MKLLWYSILWLGIIQISSATLLLKHIQIPRPGGILDAITKPKPKPPSSGGFQAGIHIGAGSFGFGIGFGVGGHGSQGGYVPPNERPYPPNKPEEEEKVYPIPDREDNDKADPWEDDKKDKVGPRPNWEEDEKKYPVPDREDKDKVDPLPDWGEDVDEEPPPSKLEDSGDETYIDWEDIGEEKEKKLEDFMEGDFINSGLIQPRLNGKSRSKRFIESRVYHVPLMFRSNAKPFQVKVRSSSNSLEKGSLGM